MDYSLAIFLVVILLFAVSGYRSGFLLVLSRLVSLPAAYLITLLFAKPFAHWLQGATSLEGLMVYIVAGSVLFFATAAVLSMLFGMVRRALAQTNPTTSRPSAIAGATLGGVIGIGVGLLAVWFSSSMQTLIQKRLGQSSAPSAFSQHASQLVGKAIGSVAQQVSAENDLSQAAVALIANPAENIDRFERINQKGVVQELFRSPAVRAALDSRNAARLMQTPAFQALVAQPDFKALARELTGSDENVDINRVMAAKITGVWAQVDTVKNDARFITLTQDPEVAKMMREGNVYQMMNSAKIESLLNIIASVEPPEISFDLEVEGPVKTPEAQPTIFRWVDEQGKVHYSDKKPAEEH